MVKMTLEDAIFHAEEVAEKNRKTANFDKENPKVWNDGGKRLNECIKCAEEHEQLAKWLKQLRDIKQVLDDMVEKGNSKDYHNEGYKIMLLELKTLGDIQKIVNS